MRRRTLLLSAALCLAAIVLAFVLGQSYVGRLPNHAGYFLVPVADEVRADHGRPRHTVVIVVDGLARSFAEGFRSRERLALGGQCRVMKVGPITVSRPEYSVLSTGLEQDRAGSRNNDETSPLAAESIWQVARRSGLTVAGFSPLPWWQQLFPDGFDRYEIVPIEDDPFARAPAGDLTLVHPLYVDEVGHLHGTASPEYASAAAKADAQIGALLDRVDLAEDLVVLTSDHGHMSYGGHGGQAREVSEVLTCYAGRGVALRAEVGRMDSRSFAPTLAVLLGVPFPRHMRALEDDLDVIFDIVDPSRLPPAYVADRRTAIERFRAANREALRGWLGDDGPPSWTRLYASEARRQEAKLALGLMGIGVVLAATFRLRRAGPVASAASLVWAMGTLAVTLVLYRALRGSLDFTSINARAEFLRAGLGSSAVVAATSAWLHARLLGDRNRLIGDELTLVGLAVSTSLLHIAVYGWPLGFPLPAAGLLFFPFFAPLFLVVHAALGAALSVAALLSTARPS